MRSPENVVFAAVQLLPEVQRDIVNNRWGMKGLSPCVDLDEVSERLEIPRLLTRRYYARAIQALKASDLTRRALAAFELRRAA